MIAELGTGQSFSRYRYASNTEVVQLFADAGIDPANDPNFRESNLPPVTQLTNLVGTTLICCGFNIGAGMTGTASGGETRSIGVLQRTTTAGMSYLSNTVPDERSYGHWLVVIGTGSTAAGLNIPVVPVDPVSGTAPVSLTFNTVTQSGTTSISIANQGNPPPTGFKLGSPPVYYELTTTAIYTGSIKVCISYNPVAYQNPPNLKLFHGTTGGWTDVTTSNDLLNHVICGTTTSLSPFILAELRYDFLGFFQPIDNPGSNDNVVNVTKAGSGIPVKFSLNGNQGLGIFQGTGPTYNVTACDYSDSQDQIEQTTVSAAGLTYDAPADQYIYVWKTEKSWATKCLTFQLGLKDGSDHHVLFRFTK
jgi:hypothetical protein